jgi:hypothetical protein
MDTICAYCTKPIADGANVSQHMFDVNDWAHSNGPLMHKHCGDAWLVDLRAAVANKTIILPVAAEMRMTLLCPGPKAGG